MKDICPVCGNATEFVEGFGLVISAINSKGKMTDQFVRPKSLVCKKCGTVVRTYVEDPEKLVYKK